jgi:hypothetical protein
MNIEIMRAFVRLRLCPRLSGEGADPRAAVEKSQLRDVYRFIGLKFVIQRDRIDL